jgi:hypothetical protein
MPELPQCAHRVLPVRLSPPVLLQNLRDEDGHWREVQGVQPIVRRFAPRLRMFMAVNFFFFFVRAYFAAFHASAPL